MEPVPFFALKTELMFAESYTIFIFCDILRFQELYYLLSYLLEHLNLRFGGIFHAGCTKML